MNFRTGKNILLLANLIIVITVIGFFIFDSHQTGKLLYLDLVEKVILAGEVILSMYLNLKFWKTRKSEILLKEKELVKSQEKFKRFSEVTREGIFIHDNGVIVDSNQTLSDMIGIPVDELIGKNDFAFWDKDSMAATIERFKREGYTSDIYEVLLRRRDGRLIPAEVHGKSFHADGKQLRVVSLWDITHRKITEEALSHSENNFRNLIEQSPDGVLIHSLEDMTLIYVNEAMVKFVGYSADELIGKKADIFVHSKDVRGVHERVARMKAKGNYNPPQEKMFVRKDGQTIHAETVSFLIHYEGVPMTAVVVRDLTERKKSEQALKKYERLSAIGEMAAGMSHEIRNPLAAISTAAQILKRKKIRGDNGQLETILEQTDRLEKLVRDTLDYGKTSMRHVRNIISVKSVLESALNLSQVQFGPAHKRVQIHWDLPPEDIQVTADSRQILQILVNLILNAFQIMNGDGEIKLGMKSDRGFAFIRVEDNGPGISNENFNRIFEPFFTTKDQGSGLGLAISQRIAQEHGGQIVIERLAPRGTAFILQLPLNGK
jgi:two-component system, sporulation sensor kinase A